MLGSRLALNSDFLEPFRPRICLIHRELDWMRQDFSVVLRVADPFHLLVIKLGKRNIAILHLPMLHLIHVFCNRLEPLNVLNHSFLFLDTSSLILHVLVCHFEPFCSFILLRPEISVLCEQEATMLLKIEELAEPKLP